MATVTITITDCEDGDIRFDMESDVSMHGSDRSKNTDAQNVAMDLLRRYCDLTSEPEEIQLNGEVVKI